MFRKVVVAVSGGVDSAVAALLLKNKGFEVQAAFMLNWDIADEKGYCSADNDYKDACELCDTLNIPIKRVNFVKEYWTEVFTYLVKEYQAGFTPNPDVVCNRRIKFNHFFDYATKNLQADAIATGHYANTSFGRFLEQFEPNANVRLLKAVDERKDQTLFLSQVNQRALQRTMFPVGGILKSEVKKIAFDNGLEKFATKKESMGICFIGSRNFHDFITEYVPDKPGSFVDIDTGQVIGKHEGIHKWTLGQRSKISGLPEAYYTAAKITNENIIIVAKGSHHPALHSSLLFTDEAHWIHSKPSELTDGGVLECNFRFQHVDQEEIGCSVCETSKGLVVQLSEHMRALTPGQYAVFYKNEECLGSAKILCAPTEFTLNLVDSGALRSDVPEKKKGLENR